MRWQLSLVVLTACYGDNLTRPGGNTPDAAVTDAALCSGGEAFCDGACLAVDDDEQNCGDCSNQCAGGEVCTTGNCDCPDNPIPTFIFPLGVEQFFPLGFLTIALAPTVQLGGGFSVNGLLFGYDNALPLDTDIDLANVQLGGTPFVAALVGLDIMNLPMFSVDATYAATAGTIRFTKLCDTEIQGTITDAVFNGVGGDILNNGGLIDPEGCEVQVNTITFHLMTAPCAPPNK